jgi:uncharacterized protein (DUF1330 family)
MTVYILAQLTFTDVAAYRRYQAKFPAVLSRFDARVLVADESPKVIDGDWKGNKIVIIGFRDEAEFERFHNDSEYQTISCDRKAGAPAVVLSLKSFD